MPVWLFVALCAGATYFVAIDEPGYAILPLGLGIFLNGQIGLMMAQRANRKEKEHVDSEAG